MKRTTKRSRSRSRSRSVSSGGLKWNINKVKTGIPVRLAISASAFGALFVMVCVVTFWIVFSTFNSLGKQTLERTSKVSVIGTKVHDMFVSSEKFTMGLHGMRRTLAELMLDDTLAKRRFTIFWNLISGIASSHTGSGHYNHEVVIFSMAIAERPNKIHTFGYSNGLFSVGIGENYTCTERTFKVNNASGTFYDEESLGDDFITATGKNTTWGVTAQSYEYWFTSYHQWTLNVGYGSDEQGNFQPSPFLALNSNEKLANVSDGNGGLKQVGMTFWFGNHLSGLSAFLKNGTPDGTISWLVEVYSLKVFATSTKSWGELLKGMDYYTLQELGGYISSITTAIVNNADRMKLLTDNQGKVVSFTLSPYNVVAFLTYEPKYKRKVLLINIKTIWSTYQESIIFISVFGVICFFTISISIGVLIVITCSAYTSVYRMLKELKKIEVMDLDNLNFDDKSIFSEIRHITSVLKGLAAMLKKYRAFLPQVLVRYPGNDSSATASNYAVPSSGGNSAYSNDSSICGPERDNKFDCGLKLDRIYAVRLVYDVHSENYEDFYSGILKELNKFQDTHVFRFDDVEMVVLFKCKYILSVIRFALCVISSKIGKLSLHADGIRCFIAHGNSVSGYVGCEKQKYYVARGQVFRFIEEITKNAPQNISIPVLVHSKMVEALEGKFETRMVNEYSHEIGKEIQVEMNEWMYELANAEKFKRWDLYNSSIAKFEEKKIAEAKKLMKEFMKIHPKDNLAKLWMSKWKYEV